MPKKEVVNNDLFTVRVDEAPIDAVENVASTTIDTVEKTFDVVEDQLDIAEKVVRNNPYLIAGVAVVALGVGAVIAYKIAEKRTTAKYEDILACEIEAARVFYKRLAKEGEFDSPEGAVKALVPEEVVDAVSKYQGNADIPKVPYDKAPRNKTSTVVEAIEVKTNVFEEAQTNPLDWDYNAEIANRTPDKPYVISIDEFGENEDGHEQATITYYADDDTLADERDQMIDNSDYTVGDDNLLRFGHGSNDERIVYVRNERIQMDFEIVRSEGSYSKEVLGFDPDSESTIRHSRGRRPRKSKRFDE